MPSLHLGATAVINSVDPCVLKSNYYFYPSAWVDQRKQDDIIISKNQARQM